MTPPRFPTPIGVLYEVDRPAYETGVRAQLDAARARPGAADLDQAPAQRRRLVGAADPRRGRGTRPISGPRRRRGRAERTSSAGPAPVEPRAREAPERRAARRAESRASSRARRQLDARRARQAHARPRVAARGVMPRDRRLDDVPAGSSRSVPPRPRHGGSSTSCTSKKSRCREQQPRLREARVGRSLTARRAAASTRCVGSAGAPARGRCPRRRAPGAPRRRGIRRARRRLTQQARRAQGPGRARDGRARRHVTGPTRRAARARSAPRSRRAAGSPRSSQQELDQRVARSRAAARGARRGAARHEFTLPWRIGTG